MFGCVGPSDISPTASVIRDSCQSEIYMFLLGTQAAADYCKTETSVLVEGGETSELVRHKLAYFVCLFNDLLLVETTGFTVPLVDEGQLTAHNYCGQNEDIELGQTLEEGHC